MSEQKLFKEMKVFSLSKLMVDGPIFLNLKKDEYNFLELNPLTEWLLENGCTKNEKIIIV